MNVLEAFRHLDLRNPHQFFLLRRFKMSFCSVGLGQGFSSLRVLGFTSRLIFQRLYVYNFYGLGLPAQAIFPVHFSFTIFACSFFALSRLPLEVVVLVRIAAGLFLDSGGRTGAASTPKDSAAALPSCCWTKQQQRQTLVLVQLYLGLPLSGSATVLGSCVLG